MVQLSRKLSVGQEFSRLTKHRSSFSHFLHLVFAKNYALMIYVTHLIRIRFYNYCFNDSVDRYTKTITLRDALAQVWNKRENLQHCQINCPYDMCLWADIYLYKHTIMEYCAVILFLMSFTLDISPNPN